MFLSNSTIAGVVMTQVKFKLKAYNGLIYSLIILQLMGIMLASGTAGSWTSIDNISINLKISSIDTGFLLVSLLAISVGNLLTTKAYRYDDFSFVATRLSSNIANSIVLLIFSCFAGITTFLTGYIMRIILTIYSSSELVGSPGIFDNPVSSILTILAMIVLLWMFSSIGYLAGTLFQKHKLLFFGALVIIFWLLLMSKTWVMISESIFGENGSLLILAIKIIGITVSFFAASVAISNRLEVRS